MNLQKQSESIRAKGGKRILVVDDDASVRQMLTRVLAEEGYVVWAAANL